MTMYKNIKSLVSDLNTVQNNHTNKPSTCCLIFEENGTSHIRKECGIHNHIQHIIGTSPNHNIVPQYAWNIYVSKGLFLTDFWIQ